VRNRQEFNDVNATFASFIFLQQGLRSLQSSARLLLSQSSAHARRDHKAAKSRLLATI
jgi:hypothetical protein